MTTWQDVAREYFPEDSDEILDFILWNKTAFPFADEAKTREQLATYQRACALGRDVCFCCGKIRFKSQLSPHTGWCEWGQRNWDHAQAEREMAS